jgi:hypothetical protein
MEPALPLRTGGIVVEVDTLEIARCVGRDDVAQLTAERELRERAAATRRTRDEHAHRTEPSRKLPVTSMVRGC